MIENKPFYKSKTKWAALLGGVGVALPGIISGLNGSGFGVNEIWMGFVIILGVFGLRDLPVFN